MVNLEHIAQGWFNLVRKELGILPSVLQQKADRRLKICSTCKYRGENKCLKCGCFIKAKVLSNDKCPLNYWKD